MIQIAVIGMCIHHVFPMTAYSVTVPPVMFETHRSRVGSLQNNQTNIFFF